MKRRTAAPQFIHRVVERLGKAYRPHRIILFGSYANGHPTAVSDVDLLIVKRTSKPFHQRLFEVRRLASPLLRGRPFDPIVITPTELRRRLAKGDQFVRMILTTGKLVYGGRN